MANQAATLGELHKLQRLVVQSLTQRISQDIDDNIPTDAATLGVVIKLLKDNAVTADPADSDDLSKLRDKLADQAKRRRTGSNVVALATADLEAMQG